MHLNLRVASWIQRVKEARDQLTEAENVHRDLAAEVDRRLGHLRRDVAELQAVIQRLEERLDRLTYASQPLSDDELDSEDFEQRAASASFWAEWRQQRDERQRSQESRYKRRTPATPQPNGLVRQLYRKLARLIHPDLARDAAERARRETAMRLANAAYEASDGAQLERLLTIWERVPDAEELGFSFEDLERQLEQLQHELHGIEGRHVQLESGETGELLRMTAGRRHRRIESDAERLRRELASLRLKRRRLQRALDALREELSEVSD